MQVSHTGAQRPGEQRLNSSVPLCLCVSFFRQVLRGLQMFAVFRKSECRKRQSLPLMDSRLGHWMQWLMTAHVRRYHRHYGTVACRAARRLEWAGPEYAGSIMNQADEFFAPEIELVDKLRDEVSRTLLLEFFVARTQRHPFPYIHAECFTFGIFDDLLNTLGTAQAFDLIPHAVPIVLDQTRPDLLDTAFSLLDGLVRASDTTELPIRLAVDWDRLRERAKTLSPKGHVYWCGLREWYRRI